MIYEIQIKIPNFAHIPFYIKQLAKSGFIDEVTEEDYEYNRLIESIIEELKSWQREGE